MDNLLIENYENLANRDLTSLKENGIQIANGEWFGESKRYFRLGFGYMEIEKLKNTDFDVVTPVVKVGNDIANVIFIY